MTRTPYRKRNGDAAPRAENFGDLILQITKSSIRAVNLETITSMLLWQLIWPLNGFNLARAKRKLLRRRKRVDGYFSTRLKCWNSFTLTIRWNWANLLKIYHGIIVLPQLIDLRRTALLNKQCAGVKEVTSAAIMQWGLDEQWWADSME